MRKRISAATDMKILQLLSTGITHKEIASRCGVSASYVSKIKTGRKVPDVWVPMPQHYDNLGVEVFADDVTAILSYVKRLEIVTSPEEVVKYLETQIQELIVQIKINLKLLEKYKEEK